SNLRGRTWSASLGRTALMLVPFVAIVAVYTAIRTYVGLARPQIGTGYYDIQLGFNIVRNLVGVSGSAVMPAGHVPSYLARRERDVAMLGLVAASTVGLLVAVLYGHYRAGTLRLALVFGLLALTGQFPVMLMHLSEVYIYNSMPFIAIIIGSGIGALLAEG